MKKRYVALGFYQARSTANTVIDKLKKANFTAFATIEQKHDHTIILKRNFPILALLRPIIAALLLGSLLFFTSSTAVAIIAAAGLAALFAVVLFYRSPLLIDSKLLDAYKNRVVMHEILIIVEVRQASVRDVLTILRQVESGHPFTFLLRPALFEKDDIEILTEPLSLEQLKEQATQAATSEAHVSDKSTTSIVLPLIQTFKKSSYRLHMLQRDISDAEFIEQTMPSAASWLLDNMYMLEGSIEDVRRNLPKKYYKALPALVDGPKAGYPRIYDVAIELVKNTSGTLSRENITGFLESYQAVQPLTIGELWAFPLMLRFRLIEWIEFLAIHVDIRMREGELAGFWGNRLLYASRHDPNKVPEFLKDLTAAHTSLSSHFVQELLDHLFDEEAIIPLVRQWAEEYYGMPLAQALHQEHVDETSEQVLFSNSIKSLITLSHLSWHAIFEEVSPVDAILKQDIDGIYPSMDFKTRNSYREVVEEIARGIHGSEVAVAKKALSFATKGTKAYEKHVGFYLVDKRQRK